MRAEITTAVPSTTPATSPSYPKVENVLVFIHGGLNSPERVLGRLTDDNHIIEHFDRAPGDDETPGKYFPIFVSWPSDLTTTYLDLLGNYRQGMWENIPDRKAKVGNYLGVLMHSDVRPDMLGNWLAPVRMGGDALQAVFNMPLDTAKALGRYWYHQSQQNNLTLQDINCTLTHTALAKRDTNIDHDLGVDHDLGIDLGCVPTADEQEIHDRSRNLLYVLTTPLRPIENGVIDPVGKRAWLAMVARAKFAARQPCAIPSYAGATTEKNREDYGKCEPGGLAELFMMLQDLAESVERDQSADAPPRLVVTVVAHSAGAILANEIIERYPCVPYKNVVFMAAAVTIRDTINGTLSVLDGKQRGQLCKELDHETKTRNEPGRPKLHVAHQAPLPFAFYNLSLHPKAEARSKDWRGAIPAGSLLEWIDDIFVDPADPLERTLGQWTNVMAAMNCKSGYKSTEIKSCDPLFFNGRRLAALRGSGLLHFKRFGLNADDPHYHGDFSNGSHRENGVTFAYWNPNCWLPGTDSCAVK